MAKNGHLLENLNPPINPEAEIDDPDDHKPSDWVDDPKIPGMPFNCLTLCTGICKMKDVTCLVVF